MLWQSVTQGVASLALGYALVGLSARPAYQCLGCLLLVDFLESAILQKKIDIQQQRRFKQCVCGNFCHDSRFLGLVNSSKKRSVFLRNDIGIRSEWFFAQMERVLASLRVQSYNAKKGNPNFLQICGVSKC